MRHNLLNISWEGLKAPNYLHLIIFRTLWSIGRREERGWALPSSLRSFLPGSSHLLNISWDLTKHMVKEGRFKPLPGLYLIIAQLIHHNTWNQPSSLFPFHSGLQMISDQCIPWNPDVSWRSCMDVHKFEALSRRQILQPCWESKAIARLSEPP